MFYKIKIFVFYTAKFLGLFIFSRRLHRSNLRILCYHGFTMHDEHEFRAGLFIKPDIFAKRMKYLTDKQYNVITLQEAHDLKQIRNFPRDAVVLTIDDGFYSVLKECLPILTRHDFPATLYLTSYYFDKDCPIFNLAVSYMFFKTPKKNVSFKDLNIPGLVSQDQAMAAQKIIDYGTTLKTEDDRINILRTLGFLLGIDYDVLNKSRLLNLIKASELNEMIKGKIDIQLHTHRHTFPEDHKLSKAEIEKNKQKINPLLSKPMTHFCYPSGVWNEEHWPLLEQQKIQTATTCKARLVNYDTPNYSLDRILDDTRVSQIEFEAEISGFNELIRRIRNK